MDGLDPNDPSWIGGYRLLGRLGEGGMGRVYLARSDRGRTVAVKVVKEELARRSDFRQRFAQEVRAARRVGGEWTAPVLDADTEAATPWVATGYVAGPSLSQVVEKQYGPLPAKSVHALATGLVHALRAIHGAGLVHRDLKPSNVLVTIDGPRVIDFGIARALDAATQSGGGLTGTGALLGSPGFMSPEQVRGEQVTFASDIFCLGAVLAYTATGQQPFGSGEGGVHSLLFRIAEGEADLTGVPEQWQGLIADCLTKDPAGRPTLDTLLTRIEEMESGTDTARSGAWLPGEVLAELGRHAVRLLDSEDPEGRTLPGGATGSQPQWAGQAPTVVPGFGPPLTYAPAAPVWSTPHPGSLPQVTAHSGGFPAPAFTPSFVPPPLVRPARGLSAVLAILLCLYVLPLLLRTVVLEIAFSQLDAEDDTALTAGIMDYDALVFATDVADTLNVVAHLGVIIAWSFWFHRMRLNAEAFAPGRIRHGIGLAVGSWFIPVVNLFMPKRIANDIWTATTAGRASDSRSLLNAWWWCWLGYFVMYVNDGMSTWYEADFAAGANDAIFLAQFTNVLGIGASALALAFVLRLTSLQRIRMGA
ncbi:protein kinase domain-containing protein [Streptomyces paludis]|uniref:DUF4328 domain-containing protein n=1 Tax=Streptomyces paludis TaxID=2282738 RepID=A0A345HYE6_9ACTN|nr:DUF4328 domain-containing protein [Streptomyces paludis]AXG81720.1 DUF4328 domain-containing protein [Streptomyces paludis]